MHYISGQKRYQHCEIYIIWKGLWCPCCGCRLWSELKSSKYKLVLRRKEKKENIIKIKKVSNSKQKIRNNE